jgi:hypothetical protein
MATKAAAPLKQKNNEGVEEQESAKRQRVVVENTQATKVRI